MLNCGAWRLGVVVVGFYYLGSLNVNRSVGSLFAAWPVAARSDNKMRALDESVCYEAETSTDQYC